MKLAKRILVTLTMALTLTFGISLSAGAGCASGGLKPPSGCSSCGGEEKDVKKASMYKKAVIETKEIFVNGECGMCEDRIEKETLKFSEISSASWDGKTKTLTYGSNDTDFDVTKLHNALAKVGHDTKKATADDATYNSLPPCCKYR